MDKAPQPAAPFAAHFQTPLVVQALTLLSLIVVWECIGRTGLLFPDLFPSVVDILRSLWIYVTTPVMIPHLKASLYEVGGAIALAAVSGIPLGILWGSRRSWLEVVEPLILYAAVVPKIVIFPIFILFLGIDVHSKLAVGAIAAFFPIALLTIAGMRDVKKVYVDVALMANRRKSLPAGDRRSGVHWDKNRHGRGRDRSAARGNQDRQGRPRLHDRRILRPVPHRRYVFALAVYLYPRRPRQHRDEIFVLAPFTGFARESRRGDVFLVLLCQ